jgi:cytochrome oxidase assembly protein ShyY1
MWRDLSAERDEFRRVRLTAELAPEMAALVYGGGSTVHPDVAGPGYFVFAPARLAGGRVVIDRGFVPDGHRDAAASPAAEHPGPLEMIGVLRWPELPGAFTPAPDRANNLWFVRDSSSIAQAKGWGEVAPFYIELESPAPPGALPRPTVLEVNLPDNHLQYALTWFGLAAALASVFVVWVRGRWKETARAAP